VTVLERLAECLEDVAIELGQLVEEEDPVVCPGHLAGHEPRPASDDRGVGAGVVR
jgi:hypothetical protein